MAGVTYRAVMLGGPEHAVEVGTCGRLGVRLDVTPYRQGRRDIAL